MAGAPAPCQHKRCDPRQATCMLLVPHSTKCWIPLCTAVCTAANCRYLYYDMLQSCYLFEGCPSKMIIAILSAARVEKYLPQVRKKVSLRKFLP
jgi:hypothetical protein